MQSLEMCSSSGVEGRAVVLCFLRSELWLLVVSGFRASACIHFGLKFNGLVWFYSDIALSFTPCFPCLLINLARVAAQHQALERASK